jgi:hypothetical protein
MDRVLKCRLACLVAEMVAVAGGEDQEAKARLLRELEALDKFIASSRKF